MRKIDAGGLLPLIATEGRCFFDKEEGVLYNDYTLASWSFNFEGTALYVNFTAIPDTYNPPPPPGFPVREKIPQFPWIAVFIDGAEEASIKTLVSSEEEKVCVFNSETAEKHSIKIVKLTENFRTQLGIRSVEFEGEILAADPDTRDGIEFIGDSITCGFGNDMQGENGPYFFSADENGCLTYGALTAKNLGLKPRFVCVSGISTHNPPQSPFPDFYGVDELYPLRDKILQDRLAQKRGIDVREYEPYDVSEHPVKYVVVNLGTNDGNQIYFAPDKKAAELVFRNNYTALIRLIREINGPDTEIILTLGPMDYYLFDVIRDVCAELSEAGDLHIHCMKFGKMMIFGPDAGGAGHPSVHRHRIMADELSAFIRNL